MRRPSLGVLFVMAFPKTRHFGQSRDLNVVKFSEKIFFSFSYLPTLGSNLGSFVAFYLNGCSLATAVSCCVGSDTSPPLDADGRHPYLRPRLYKKVRKVLVPDAKGGFACYPMRLI